jgi:hypothetical protein
MNATGSGTSSATPATEWLDQQRQPLGLLDLMVCLIAAFCRRERHSLAVGVLVADLLLIVPATTDPSAWYVGEVILVAGISVALAAWAFYTSVTGRLWRADLFR